MLSQRRAARHHAWVTGPPTGPSPDELPLNQRCASERTVSISLRVSSSWFLSLISLLEIHVLIWSRSRWSFLICVLRSVSHLSFCVELVDAFILSKIDSNCSTPSWTFLSVRSISAEARGQGDTMRGGGGGAAGRGDDGSVRARASRHLGRSSGGLTLQLALRHGGADVSPLC